MSNYNSLKTTINANIKQNGNQEITGQILNSVLNAMVTTLGTGYQFAGVATTATDPGSPDAKVFYIANGKGTYTNFGGVEVMEDDVVVLYWDSSWHKVSTGIASQEKLSELESNISIKEEIIEAGTGGVNYPYNFIVGKTYIIRSISGSSVTLSTKRNGSVVETIGTLRLGETIEFTPTVAADTFRIGYGTNISVSISIKNDFVERFSEIEDSIVENAKKIGNVENVVNNGSVLFESAGTESVPYIFEQGKIYCIERVDENFGGKATISLRNEPNAESFDVFDIYAKEQVELTPSADAKYLRIGSTTGVIKIRVTLKNETDRRIKLLENERDANILGQQVNRQVFHSVSGGEYFVYTFKAGNEYVVERTDTGSANAQINASSLKREYKLIGELAGGDKVIFVPDVDYPLLRIGYTPNVTVTITAKSDIQNRLSDLEHKYDIADHSLDHYEKKGYWEEVEGKVNAASSSYQARMTPIAIEEGDTVIVNNTLGASVDRALFTDADDNVIKSVGPLDSFEVIAPAGTKRVYLNVNPAYSISILVKSAIAKMAEEARKGTIEIPLLAPMPQLPANDSAESDFNAETVTSEQLQSAFETLIDSLPVPNRKRYANPKFGNMYEVVGKDASGTYDIKSYVFGLRNRFAWKATNKLYAWKSGNTKYYIDSVCPRIGDVVYSNAQRSLTGYTISDYNAQSETITLSNGSSFTRSKDDNIEADIIWTSSVGNTTETTLGVYDRSNKKIGDATWQSTSLVSYNGKAYTRCESHDYHTDHKATIVLWGNEHAAQSDPHEPSIILYRLAKDLCSFNSTNKFITFLKRYCKVVLLPCANPYGMNKWASDHREGRTNANNVNINRNYDCPYWETFEGEPKGNKAGDQSETQYIMNLVDAIGATMAIDIHCLGYVTEANDGVCAYEHANEINGKIVDTMSLFGIEYTSYGNPMPNTSSTGPAWIYKMGISGGLMEMNAGRYARSYDGNQHTGNIMAADYTQLLNIIRMYYHNIDPSFRLANLKEF